MILSSPPAHASGRARARSLVPALLLGAGMALIGWYLVQRTLGLYPGVFMDEWYYSKMARLAPLSEAAVPSYLYLLVFGAGSSCGPGFLDCVRIGNVLFHVGAAPFLYLVARRVLPAPLACAVALLALLLPLNLYTSYFMPESMYFFGFALLAWVALAGVAWRAWLHALLAGAVLGLMSLVKVHAVFLLPALCLYLVYASRFRDPAATARTWIVRGLGAALLAALATAAVKLLLGWLLAGDAGLTLFGSFYAAGASSASQQGLLSRLLPASLSARGHAMGLAVLLGFPLAALLHALVRQDTHRAGNPLGLLTVFTALMLGSALGLAVLYTASIASDGPLEGFRLHSRYYSFALPLLLVAAAAATRDWRDAAARPGVAQILIALALAGLLALAWTRLPGFDPRITDGPEFTPLIKHDNPVIALFALQALLLALWLRYRRAAAWGFLVVALPLALFVTDADVRTYLGHLRTAPPADRAGIAARDLIPPAERSATIIVANGADLFRTQFHIDHPDMILLDLPDGAPIEAYRLPSTARWLVAVGRHPLPPGMAPALANDAFAIVKLPRPERSLVGEFAFHVAPGPGRLVEHAEGLSNVEAWGRWSDGKQVTLRFARPLPARLTVVLTAGAFGPNTAEPFTLRAGEAAAQFRLAWEAREVVLDLDTDGRQQTLVIEVPRPTRPSDLGNSTDTRLLGISLTRLRIEERKPKD